jgi:DNA-binding beta-propeller fold protein YncE
VRPARARRLARGARLPALGLVLACQGVSPLTNRIAVGEQPFVVFVGEGQDGWTDLYAADAAGGTVVRLTFTRDRESAPALHPNGGAVAFVRDNVDGSTVLAVLNLVNAAEREVVLSRSADMRGPWHTAWSSDGMTLYVQSGTGAIAATPAPPHRLVLNPLADKAPERQAADSALRLLLGSPAFASVERCPSAAEEFCVRTSDGTTESLGPAVRDPFRWGADSLGYLEYGRLTVRPLGGGLVRRVHLVQPPAQLRQPTYHPGAPPAAPVAGTQPTCPPPC